MLFFLKGGGVIFYYLWCGYVINMDVKNVVWDFNLFKFSLIVVFLLILWKLYIGKNVGSVGEIVN